jgi:hypothetical protein
VRKLIALITLITGCYMATFAQKVEEVPTYQKYPALPAFNILLTDSSTIFNTYNLPAGTPVVLMLFDPECKHCRDLTRMLVASMDSLKDVNFCLVTANHDMQAIRRFATDLKLEGIKNIVALGQDYEFFFLSFYKVSHVPDLAVYNADKKFVALLQNKTTIEELYKLTHTPTKSNK